MNRIHYVLFILVFFALNCYRMSRQLKSVPSKNIPTIVKATVLSDIAEIVINRKWNLDSYLKPTSLNSYTIYLNTEQFKNYFRDKLQEKLAESILKEDDKARVEVDLIAINYTIEKDFGVLSPSEKITSYITANAVIFIYGKRHEVIFENLPSIYNRPSFNLFLLWSSVFGLLRVTYLEPGYSGLGASLVTASLFYFSERSDNIENFLEGDLNHYSYILRDKLEIMKKTNTKTF